MLVTLSIKNFLLIEATNLDFSSGFYAITGDTGSGKSMILDALMFALGARSNPEIVRDGADFASVIAEFTINDKVRKISLEYGIDLSDSLIIKRQQFKEGRKKCYINDEPVSLKTISIIAESLLEIHGQHSYGNLLKPSYHLGILDDFANITDSKNLIQEKYNLLNSLITKKKQIEDSRISIEREIEFLEYAVSELNSKMPEIGEENSLSEKRINLRNSEKRSSSLVQAKEAFESGNFSPKISSIQRILSNSGDENFDELMKNLEQVLIYLDEVENSIKSLSLESSEENLEEVESRLFEIRDLSRKYKLPADELPKLYEKYELELSDLTSQIKNSDKISAEIKSLEDEYKILAKTISEKRKNAAIDLSKKVTKELELLNMKDCNFVVEVSTMDKHTSTGMDNVRFVASINKGQAMQPIDRIASGGEMSRLMLALNIVLFNKYSVGSIVFDEIDTGIGGKIASSVGERLKELSKVVQTIAITHQPQVASKADHNILVTKSSSGNISKSDAKFLSLDEKKEEIARMISGQEITQKTRDAATELLGQ